MCWNLKKKKYIPEDLQLHLKKAPTQLLSCEYCEIFKNTYFEEHLQTTASLKSFCNVYMFETPVNKALLAKHKTPF